MKNMHFFLQLFPYIKVQILKFFKEIDFADAADFYKTDNEVKLNVMSLLILHNRSHSHAK